MKARRSKKPGKVVLEMGRFDDSLLAAGTPNTAPPHAQFALNRILVPIDFSECSRKALLYAIPLAKEHGAALTLLYVVPTQYTTYDYGGPNAPLLESQAFVAAEKQLRELQPDPAQVSSEVLVRIGSPEQDILEAARETDADLIVLSTHGRTGLRHLVMGSVAEQIVRRAPCPVLVVREKEKEFIVGT